MKRCKPRRNTPVNPADVLATTLEANDNMRVGMVEAPRKVTVTARQSIKRTFNAPRLDMGEYSPVATHQLELEKLRKGF